MHAISLHFQTHKPSKCFKELKKIVNKIPHNQNFLFLAVWSREKPRAVRSSLRPRDIAPEPFSGQVLFIFLSFSWQKLCSLVGPRGSIFALTTALAFLVDLVTHLLKFSVSNPAFCVVLSFGFYVACLCFSQFSSCFEPGAFVALAGLELAT